MGKSSKGTKGYKYFTSLVLMLGNRIECLLGVNFDKKGWQKPVVLKDDENMLAGVHQFDLPELYGDTEGGISGQLALYDGNTVQMPDPHYQQYFPLAPAYRHQSYVVLRDFYVGNSPYLKDVMFLPKRTRIRNDGSEQWYRVREDGVVVCEIGSRNFKGISADIKAEIESAKWVIKDKNNGIIHTETNLVNSISYLFSTGTEVGATGEFQANIKFSKPVHNAYFYIIGEADDIGDLSVTNARIFKLSEIDIPSFGKGYEWVVDIYDGTIEVDLSFKIKNLYESVHQGSIQLSFESEASSSEAEIQGFDINPVHKARELITDYTAMGKPESDIHDENFRAAASRIWDEGLGISWAIQEKSCKEALQELEAHIEGGFRINRQTGLYECVLFRDDLLDLENALNFDESNIKTIEFDTINVDDAINSYNVSYYDRENLKDSTFSIDDVGLIHTVGHVNAEKLDFPYFMSRRNAEIVANWKLKQASTAAWKGSFTTGRYDARKINKYDVILLSWQSKQLVNVPIRVLNISLGDGVDNTVTIDFIEVVSYSENMNTQINSDESMNTVLEPQQNNAVVFEAPYYELVQENGQANVNLELENNAEAGYLMTAVSKPQNNSIYALLYTDKATEDYTQMQKVGYVDYCPSLTLDQDISFTDSVFSVKNATEILLAAAGTLILLDGELLVYQSYDAVTNKLTVKRAALDTVPKPHLLNAVFYFFDEFRFIDTEQYVASETVQTQVLTTTPSATQKRDPIDVKTLELNARAIRPYPPANVKINDEYYPAEIDSDLVLTWVNRNRLQQTGGEILGYFDGGVTLENGVNYQLILTEFDEDQIELRTQSINVGQLNSYTFSAGAMQANTFAIQITLKSIRDSYECFQFFTHTVELSRFYSAPYDLTVEFKND
ncbi:MULTISPECIES: phage tail protein [unclassified Acinetobacter]|uniref:phage tail protein n=1 Tax=unclassified Acinetobacter TaxID=196816 RepID=UPI0025750642|nr:MULTISPECIES: phage tail protein [unclassified Acinetobacter]MDM1764618.1 hypothetical protein [Acinetobacter sp. 226-1]MDM1768614.1 hypothetical protein [Acinetobacter sp. 226-4]